MYNQEILIKIKKIKQNLLLKISNFFNLIHVKSKFIFKYISLFPKCMMLFSRKLYFYVSKITFMIKYYTSENKISSIK